MTISGLRHGPVSGPFDGPNTRRQVRGFSFEMAPHIGPSAGRSSRQMCISGASKLLLVGAIRSGWGLGEHCICFACLRGRPENVQELGRRPPLQPAPLGLASLALTATQSNPTSPQPRAYRTPPSTLTGSCFFVSTAGASSSSDKPTLHCMPPRQKQTHKNKNQNELNQTTKQKTKHIRMKRFL